MIGAAIAAGLISGLFGSLVGLGGGVLMVPALALIFNVPMSDAIPASLVGVVATAIGGTAMFMREGHTDAPLALRAACIASIGAVVGAQLGVRIPSRVLELGFAVLLFFIVWRMLAKRKQKASDSPQEASLGRAGFLFLGAGLLAGLLGVGGGVLNVPAIRLALRKAMIVAVATSAMIIAFTGSAGAAAYASAGRLDWALAAGCATGAFAGGRVGAWLAPRLPVSALQTIFIAVIFYVGIEFAVRGLGLPWWR